jgi:hypothetical protein
LKYDNIWRRAEESFINKKKSGVDAIDEEDEDEG